MPVLLAFLSLLSVSALAEAGPARRETFIHWSAANLERLSDGRVKAVLTLENSGIPLENQAAYYRLAKLGRFRGERAPEDSEIHSLAWEADGRRVVVQSGEFSRVTVFARAEMGGRPLYAQTSFNLYGQARSGHAAETNPLAQAPDWPEFLVGSDGPSYWPQTGQIFTFQLKGEDSENLTVWDAGRRVAELAPGPDGFQYKIEPDPALDRAGNAASKPLVFVSALGDGGLAALTLFVHRSRLAGLNPPAGLGIFAAAAALAATLVWMARRRISPCA